MKTKDIYRFYYLQDPVNGDIRYVGMTTENLRQRLYKHISETMRPERNSPKTIWVRELYNRGLRPLINEIECVKFPCIELAGEREKYYIARFRQEGHDLTNATDGGLGTPGHVQNYTDEWRQKIGEKSTKYHITEQQVVEAVELRRNGATWESLANGWGMSRTNFNKEYRELIKEMLDNDGIPR